MRVAINLLTDDPANPSGAHWFWTRVIPEMAKSADRRRGVPPPGEPEVAPAHEGYGRASTTSRSRGPTSGSRCGRSASTFTRRSGCRRAKIDVFNTLMAPIVKPAPSLVVPLQDHARLHRAGGDRAGRAALSADELPAHRARLADAIIINSESLRQEVEQLPGRRPGEAAPHPGGGGPRAVPAGGPGRGRGTGQPALRRRRKPFVLFVSSLWPYKNCAGLLRAFAAAKSELGDRQLVDRRPRPRQPSTSPSCTRWPTSWASPKDVVWVGGVPLEETVHFYRSADVFVYPSFNETFGLPILEAMACGCPVVTSNMSAMPETAGGAALLADPHDPESIADAIVEACGPEAGSGCARAGPCGRPSSPGRRPPSAPWRCTARSTRATRGGRPMRILVTGGAGFIGSHTCDRLVELGHDVVVLDALTAPVHRDGEPSYLTPGVELFVGDVRNRDLRRQPAAPGGRGLPLRRLPGLPARLRPLHRRQRHLDGDDLRDHRRGAAGSRPGRRRLVAVGDGGGPLPLPRARRADPGHAAGAALERARVGPALPGLRGPLEMLRTPGAGLQPAERLRDVQARRGDGRDQPRRRYGIPTVALRYSIVQGPRQSVYNAYSGRLPDLLPALPARAARRPCTRTGRPSATTSTSTTWSTPTCWC